MSTPPQIPGIAIPESDPDDIAILQDDTRRENDRLAKSSRSERELRRLRTDANRDSQDFRDLVDGSQPQTFSDVAADARDELEEQERLDVLDGLRALQTGDPINWKIYRVGAQDADMNGYLGTWSTSQLTQERLKDEYGGGTYRIRGSATNGRYVGGRTIHIAGDAIRKEKTNVSQTGNGSFNLSEFLTQQEARDAARRRDEDSRHAREKQEATERHDRERRERNELLAIVVPAVTSLTTAIVGAFAGNRGPDIAGLIAALKPPDPLTMLTQLKALSGNNQGLAEKLVPMLLDKATDSGGGGETGWMDIVKEVVKSAGPTVGGMIETAVTQARANAAAQVTGATGTTPPAASLPAPAPVIVMPESQPRRERRTPIVTESPRVGSAGLSGSDPRFVAATVGAKSTTSTPVAPEGDMNFMTLAPHWPWLREQLARMGTAAVRGRDPDVYAALLLEELPENLSRDTVYQLLSRNDWYQLLCQVEPRLNRQDLVQWFTTMRTHLLNYISPGSVASAEVAAPNHVPVAAPILPVPAPTPAKPAQATGEIQRPTKPPSLTGD